ncbi:MAG: cytochrome b [Alphaproteobacteria bacterium]
MDKPATYSPLQKVLHWLTAILVIILIPLGIKMVERYNAVDFDAVTTRLYNSHKLLGALVLFITALRLIVRLTRGVPAPERSLGPMLRLAATSTHLALYGLLIIVPILGWVGAAAYDLRSLPFGLSLPAIVAPDKDLAGSVVVWHAVGAITLGGLALLHFGAGLMHFFVRKDGVLQRMLPGRHRT